jgi:hypothetical protein
MGKLVLIDLSLKMPCIFLYVEIENVKNTGKSQVLLARSVWRK